MYIIYLRRLKFPVLDLTMADFVSYKSDSDAHFIWGVIAEPPRASSLKNTVPLPTEEIFGPDHYFVADPRGYAVVFQPLLKSYLKMDGETVVDSRLKLGKVCHSTL